jgi:hypothetical protein
MEACLPDITMLLLRKMFMPLARLGQQIENSVSSNQKAESCGLTAHTHVLHGHSLHNNLAPVFTTMVYLLPHSILQWKVHVMYDKHCTRIQATRNNNLMNKTSNKN